MAENTLWEKLARPAGRQLILLLILIIASVVARYPLLHLTDRDRFPENGSPASKPLNMRFGGYSVNAATDYWTWLQGKGGIDAEKRFLELDLFYPFVYCGALLVGLRLVWNRLNQPFDQRLLFIPVTLTAIGDWTENLIHLRQLGHLVMHEPLNPGSIQVASIATITKWAFLGISFSFFLILCICLLFQRKSMSK